MAESTKIQVRTRDQGLVPYDEQKIVAAILEAMASTGVGDADLAEELAAAVTHFLSELHPESTVSLDQIHDMVEKVLMETANREIARSYILLREKRARIRQQTRIPSRAVPQAPAVTARHDRRSAAWDRVRIVTALIEEADLDAELAEQVAAAVEQRVVRSGWATISTGLLRELVDIELFERGLTAGLQRQASIAIPKYDLEKILFQGGEGASGGFLNDPGQVAEHIGNLVVRQYVLDEIYSEPVTEAALDGRIHLHQLDRSLQLLRVPVVADALPFDQAEGTLEDRGGPERVFRSVFRRVGDWSPHVAEEIEVSRIGPALLSQRGQELIDCDLGATALLSSLDELQSRLRRGAQAPPTVILSVPFTPRFVQASAGLFGSDASFQEDSSWLWIEIVRRALQTPDGPRRLAQCHLRIEVSAGTFRERRFRDALTAVLERMTPDAPCSCVLVPEQEDDGTLTRAVASKVTINLPRVALECRERQVAPDEHWRDLAEVVVRAARERTSFVRRLLAHPASALSGVRKLLPRKLLPEGESVDTASALGLGSAPQLAVGLLGLEEAVRIATGHSLHESPVARQQGEDWIRDLAAALSAARAPGDPELVLEETSHRAALRRFEKTDSERYEGASVQAYTSGVRFGRWAPLDPLEKLQLLNRYRPWLRLSDRLDETNRLRADGVDVLMAFLEEACKVSPQQTVTEKAD